MSGSKAPIPVPLDRVLGLLVSLQFGIESFSLGHNRLVLVLPVKTSENKTTAKTDANVGDDFSSESSGDRCDGRHGDDLKK